MVNIQQFSVTEYQYQTFCCQCQHQLFSKHLLLLHPLQPIKYEKII